MSFKSKIEALVARLNGTDVPELVLYGIYSCDWNGSKIKVVSIDTHNTGAIQVAVALEMKDAWLSFSGLKWSTPCNYAYGLSEKDMLKTWRRRMRQERRTLTEVQAR